MPFIPLLAQNWKLIIIGILVISIVGMTSYINLLKGRLDVKDGEISNLTQKLEISNSSIETLKKSIDEQNTAIENLKKAADERLKKNQAELAKAKAKADEYRKRADDLMKRRPPPNVPICKAADDLINEEIENAKK